MPETRYRRIPEYVTAEQFFIDNEPWPDCVEQGRDGMFRMTTSGMPHIVKDGDWIVTGDDGVRIRLKPFQFDATYERAE